MLPTVVPVARITANQTANGAPANVLDGNMKTAWSARGNGQYLQLDLGAVRQVGAIGVVWGPGMQPPAASLGVGPLRISLGSTSFGTDVRRYRKLDKGFQRTRKRRLADA